MSFLAWIDFDQADRDRTRRIMDLFESEDSRDELGLGSIRDSLADLMFPGTSTIQTRLRYMLFVPWIYQLAGKHAGTAAARQELARNYEIRLIEALLHGKDTSGVIGSSAREKLKRLPSDVYWSGLFTLGIRRVQGSRNACLEGASGNADTLWATGLPPAPDGFLEAPNTEVKFELRTIEADFLRDRLANEAPESLFTLLSRSGFPPDTNFVWQHEARADWPPKIRVLVDHAEMFSKLMHGASLLYNLMLCERAASLQGTEASVWHKRVDDYTCDLRKWEKEITRINLADWDLPDLWRLCRGTTHNVKAQTCSFIEAWQDSVVRENGHIHQNADARALIRHREVLLKGLKSRFRNDGALMRWSGASGTAPLNYRWKPVVRNHLADFADAK